MSAQMSAQTEPTTETTDPYLSGNYAPIDHEIVADRLPVTGKLPEDLCGLFVRTGSNPKLAPHGRYHWFDGDGMLHAVCFEDGAATYRNRYVRTDGLVRDLAAGRSRLRGILEQPDFSQPDGPYKDTSNTDVIFHAGRLLSLWWLSGRAYEIRLPDLETVGPFTWNDKLERSISAHPKIDPRTGEMVFYDYAPFPPYLRFGVVSAAGEIVHQEAVDLPGYRLQHDVALTERFTILFDMSMMYDPDLLAQGRVRLTFRKDHPSRIGVVPRRGAGSAVRWFEVEPFFMYHTINAWEEGDEIVVIGCRIEDPIAFQNDPELHAGRIPVLGGLKLFPKLHEWRLHLETGGVRERRLDDEPGEFPRMNDGWLGSRSRWAYNQHIAPASTLLFDGVTKWDLTHDRGVLHRYPKGWYGGETCFAPRQNAGDEDDGYLLTFVSEHATGRSELHVIDARSMDREPVARVAIPQRVPYGYHTRWVAAALLPTAAS